MASDHDKLQRLARMVAATRPDEVLCNEVVDVMCGYFEAIERGAELTPAQQRVAEHLEACPECVETYRALCHACRDDGDGNSDA